MAKEIFEILKEVSDSFVMDHLLDNFGHICICINNMDVLFINADNSMLTLENFEEKGKNIFYYPVTLDRCIFLLKRTVVESQLSTVIQEFSEGNFEIKNGLSDINKEACMREKPYGLKRILLQKLLV